MLEVLASPVTRWLSDARYGKSYNVLNKLVADDVHVEAIVGGQHTELDSQSVSVTSLETQTKLNYYQAVYRATDRALRSGEFDVYHHVNFGYRWFNPLVLAGRTGDVPFVAGPVQAGHEILAVEFNRLASASIGVDLPRTLTDPLHWTFDHLRDVAFDPPRLRLMERTLEAADRVIVVHEDARAVYEQHVDESKLEIVPLGVDPEEFPYQEPGEEPNLLAVGGLRERKAYDDLLEAVAQVAESFPDVHLDVFGDGPLEDDLKRLASDLGIRDAVTFHGRVDQSVVKEYMQSARAFVHPSHSESFSLVRLEAMSSGCPMVVTDTSGAREMVRDGTDGFVVPKQSPERLADAIAEVLADYDLAREMGRSARDRVERRYAWSAIADQYVDVYRDVA